MAWKSDFRPWVLCYHERHDDVWMPVWVACETRKAVDEAIESRRHSSNYRFFSIARVEAEWEVEDE